MARHTNPASASAPFVATLVDVSGLVIYFSVASIVLRGTLLSRAKRVAGRGARRARCAMAIGAVR